MTVTRPTTRICCHCGELVVVDLHVRHRNIVVRRGCPECENRAKLRPVVVHSPKWLVDGEFESVLASERASERSCGQSEKGRSP